MTSSSLKRFIEKHRIVYLDTSIFIYFIERNPRYHKFCETLFEEIETGRIHALTSTLSLLEVLVRPYKQKRADLVFKFYSLLTTYPNIEWVELTLGVSDLAARLRADYGLKTPDAIHAASAMTHGVEGFICNDVIFRKIKAIECLMLDDCTRQET